MYLFTQNIHFAFGVNGRILIIGTEMVIIRVRMSLWNVFRLEIDFDFKSICLFIYSSIYLLIFLFMYSFD